MENILFLAALLFLFSSLQRRRKKREASHDKTGKGGEERRDAQREAPAAEDSPAEEAPEPIKGQAPEEARQDKSHEEFRKKLRKAWGMAETEPAPETAEEKEEMTLPPDLDEPVYEEKPAPPAAPAPAPAPKAADAGARLFPEAPGKEERKQRERALASEKKNAPSAVLPAGRWTEADVERWALYDAVLGEPRSRRPWMPPRRRP